MWATTFFQKSSNEWRTKHIEIDFGFVRKQVAVQQLDVKYISTEDRVADMLIKLMLNCRF